MNWKQPIKCLLTDALLLCAQDQAGAMYTGKASGSLMQNDVILQWNRVVMETVSTPGQQPATIMPVRTYAMMHAAMFDAVNSIDGTYTPYLTDVPGMVNASVEAAAAYAAHAVLSALFPSRRAIFDAELELSLAGIEENRAQQGARDGL